MGLNLAFFNRLCGKQLQASAIHAIFHGCSYNTAWKMNRCYLCRLLAETILLSRPGDIPDMNLNAMPIKVLLKIVVSVCSLIMLSACYNRDDPGSSATIHPPARIPVELTTHLGDQQLFIEGDEIQFLLSLGSDAYVYMYHMDTTGAITQLIPDARQQGHFYNAGYFMTLPEYDDGYRFIVSAPYGEHRVWVFASDADITDSYVRPRQGQIIEELAGLIKQASGSYGQAQLLLNTVESE